MSIPNINIPDILDIRLNVLKDVYGTNVIIDKYVLKAKKGWNKLVFRREYPSKPIILVQSDKFWKVFKKKLEVNIPSITIPKLPKLEQITLSSLELPKLTIVSPELPEINVGGISKKLVIPDKNQFMDNVFLEAYNKCLNTIPSWLVSVVDKLTMCTFYAALISSPHIIGYQVMKTISDYANEIASQFNQLVNQLNNYALELKNSANKLKNNVEKLVNALNQFSIQLENWSSNLLNELGYDLVPKINNIVNGFNDVSTNLNSLINSLNGFINGLKNFANNINDLVKDTIGSTDLGNDQFMGYAPAIVRNVTTRSCEIYSPIDGELNILVISM